MGLANSQLGKFLINFVLVIDKLFRFISSIALSNNFKFIKRKVKAQTISCIIK